MPPANGTLTAFERTNFFYGLLMDAERLRKDHAFFNGKRWLLNRLVVGTGVVCGCDVTPVGPTAPAIVTLKPGVAIDAIGREIVVAEPRPVDPRQPTDDLGRPVGAPLAAGTVELCLAYSEVKTDLVPVLVPDCDGPGNCAASTIRESFVVIVRPATAPPPVPAGCALGAFPVPAEPALHDLLAKRMLAGCPAPAKDTCVPIARVDLATGAVDAVAGRPLVYGNRVLYELLVCLTERLSAAGNRVLRYVSGDAQSGGAGATLPAPLVVELVDGAGGPLAGQVVQFTVSTGGGSVALAQVTTAADGRASTQWTLGPDPGQQTVTTAAVGTVFTVTFHATRT